ncbi:MAG TPA: transposase [Candidatus Binatia bacterium]|nr:transposase [Candidatus Binatia bacterium]
MARPLRIQYPGAVYHVMNRGGARQKIFLEKEDYEASFKSIREIHERWRVEIFAYCLMGNHYHICLRTPEGNLSRVMRHLDGLYTQRFNRMHRRDGALLRGRYKAIVVDKDSYLAQVVRYIHLNPLEAGLVREPQAYVWSSHRFYLRPKEAPKWLRPEEVMGEFASITAFHGFVLEGNEQALEEFYKKVRQSPVLGDEEFRQRLIEKPLRVDREHPRHERAAVRPSVDKVLKALAKIYRVKVKDLLTAKRGKQNEARKVGMYLIKELCDLRLQEIAERFGTGSYGAVGWACHGVTSRMESDATFRDRVGSVRQSCQQKI